MRPIILNDENNTFIYSDDVMKETLENLGFSWREVYEYFEDFFEKDEEECTGDDWELIADGYYQNMMACRNELEVISNKLISGKGLTKDAAGKNILRLCDEYLC